MIASRIPVKGSARWSQLVLSYDPFADDKDSDGWVKHSDGVIIVRRDHSCSDCGMTCTAGSLCRRMKAIRSGDGWSTVYSCSDCCDAMVRWALGDGEPMMRRCDMGAAKAQGTI